MLFADGTALMADWEKLCRLVSEFGRVCERRKLRANVGKSLVMRCSRYGDGGRLYLTPNAVPFEKMDCLKYLWSQVAADGSCETDVVYRMNEGCRTWGALESVLNNRGLGTNAMKCIWRRNCTNGVVRIRGMGSLRSLVGVSRMDRVRNEVVSRRAGI